MQFAIHLAIFAYFATPAFCAPQGLGVQYVDPGPGAPTVPSVWLYWGECYTDVATFLTHVDDNGKEAYTPGGNEGWRLDSGCHKDLIDYDGIWIEKDPRPREREGCAYAFEDSNCCGRFEPIKLAFSGALSSISATSAYVAQARVKLGLFSPMRVCPMLESPFPLAT